MYNHKEIEQEILKFWEEKKIYEKAKKKNLNGTPFYFCDGPPYATGQIHPGTAWNKTLKDAVCRYWRMKGYNVRVKPGYDTHGLPIEVKVEQELNFKHKNQIEKYGIEKFVQTCKAFATRYIDVMSKQFKNVGVWMDFDDPYITYRDSYIESSWKILKIAWDSGLMHEGVYVLPYCYRCETTIANYELEYSEDTDPSLYAKFKIKGTENQYLIIWTTTPWTLVANMAVMVHPTLRYVRAKVDDEEWIIVKERLETLMEKLGKSATILEEKSGKKLEGVEYEHPFQDKIKKEYNRRVVLSDEYVSAEDGSGLVHTAPGTGPEDFIIGKRFGIEPFCPVNERGEYTAEAGEMFEGRNVKEMNPVIMEMMKERGSLLYDERVRHRYPHCWRCKTPLIFITTKQWFIAIAKIKDKMLNEADHTFWQPDFAKQRFREFVSGAPDWCISRQRYWGIPLPIWRCGSKGCGSIKVIDSKSELGKIEELHRPYIDSVEFVCDKCKGKMRRIEDVLDVWFDSGNSVWAQMDQEDAKKFGERADLILEGQDQIRGWFYSLLGSGIVKYNACPYKKLLMHGFFVDEKGQKMSKSLGNFIPIEEITEKYGADSFRLWGLSNTVWEELKFNWEELRRANSDLNILMNLVVFLERFYPKKKIKDPKLMYEDQWLLSRTNSMAQNFMKYFENYELNRAVKELRNFMVEDLSRFYMKIAKSRISKEEEADGALYALYESVFTVVKLASNVCPFITEKLYQQFFKSYEKEESLSFLGLKDAEASIINKVAEKEVVIVQELCSVGLMARQETEVKLRWPIRTAYVMTDSREALDAIENFKTAITKLLNVKEVVVNSEKPDEKGIEKEFSLGKVFIPSKLDEQMYEEGITNEVKRRIQTLRKEESLVEKDEIKVYIDAENEIAGIIEKNKTQLMKEVNAVSMETKQVKDMKEYDVDGRRVKIAIKKEK